MAYLNGFERVNKVTNWLKSEWVAMLITFFVRPLQQAVNILPPKREMNYKKGAPSYYHLVYASRPTGSS